MNPQYWLHTLKYHRYFKIIFESPKPKQTDDIREYCRNLFLTISSKKQAQRKPVGTF